ncbi:uncharacterized protein LACBIDRAFT_328290 [Laccaria bicolor S238N-H82]|uniref:Predicted protein n=1 Tax=Laccaria bicolor (strain S238N-H82 / ATCC MYA-4686) TaxID=486041 RepID=B0DEF3_LACBS|nr:uncharacterized protein LACBIDRAFT_328290 [Laccaria bicolor S238N-H82]EDR06924.1 predicted protein [Laccaria bicolor S238N-H82]|eukprot:XP_001882297.1 predicted protein [Laccaria bicolor S238N-H82]
MTEQSERSKGKQNPENLPIRTIIPDSASDESTIVEDSDESDEIGVESYSSGETEAEELDPGLECHDEESEEEPQKSPSFPLWFKKALEEKLAIVEKRDSNRTLIFYGTYETFWVPKKAGWFVMIKAKSLEPESLYDFGLFYWDPELLAKIKCLVCKISWLTRHGLQKIPRRCVGLDKCFWMIGARYKCPTCKNPKTGKHTVTFMSWDSSILAALPKALAAEFPVVLTMKSALSSPILALQWSLFQKGLGAKQFSNILTTLHNPGNSKQGKTAVVAISFESHIFVLQISQYTKAGKLPVAIKNILAAPNARVSLTELSALVLGFKLNKDDAIRVSTEWENINLSQDQIMYIAQDAHASKCIYEKLVQLEKYGNVPQNAAPGLPVIIYQEDGQKTIAYGAWSSLNTEENAVVDDIALQTSDKLIAIEIQKFSVPGAIIESHKKKALKDFRPPPFVLIYQLQLDAENPNSTGDSWTGDADLEVHPNSLPETPAQNLEHDPVSTQIGHEALTEYQFQKLMDSVYNLQEQFEARLKSEGSSWDEKFKFQPKSLWKLVRRYIPPPEQLYDLVENIFKTYGPLKDSIAGQPLFSPTAWKSAWNVLKVIQAGYLSDPPGIPLYYQVGLDRKKNGLPVWRCIRGTNFTEGGVHHSIRACFPDSIISSCNAVNRLADSQLHHNLHVGTKNQTGHRFIGHDDIWLYDELQTMIEKTRIHVPLSYRIQGWTNGSLYVDTSEVSGILPIPSILHTKALMQPNIPGVISKSLHQFLAQRQQTQFAVIAVHTVPEKLLFSHLIQTDPFFNRDKQEPDWKTAVQIWNRDHADSKTIFYKTNVAHLATQSQTRSQCKGVEAQIHNPERNTASQIYHAITLPVAQPPTSGKQLDQVYCPVEIIPQGNRKTKNLHRMLV